MCGMRSGECAAQWLPPGTPMAGLSGRSRNSVFRVFVKLPCINLIKAETTVYKCAWAKRT